MATKEDDPSIEEILASIRDIISEDEEEGVSTPPSIPDSDEEDEVLDLTDEIDDEPEIDLGSDEEDDMPDFNEDAFDLDLVDHETDEVEDDMTDEDRDIFTDTAAEATLDSLTRLASNVAISKAGGDVTLDSIVRDLLRPMLRQWIHENMPEIVEVMVEKELEKLIRHAKNK